MIRFLADASLRDAIVSGCLRREPAIDFLSANDANLEGVPDPEVLAIAAAQGRILITSDFKTMPRHFGEFLEAGDSSAGVFLVKQHTRSRMSLRHCCLFGRLRRQTSGKIESWRFQRRSCVFGLPEELGKDGRVPDAVGRAFFSCTTAWTTAARSGSFGSFTGKGGNRVMQLALKYIF